MNRHAEWLALSRAYRDTGDEKYAREFVAQMTAWARECPMPKDAANGPRSAWRTIETGIRAAQVWPELWYRFVLSPAMTDDALLLFLRAYIDHAHHLMAFHTTGNWLAMEGNGLYHVGVLFPEFRGAASWRETAGKWIYTEMNNQVYPDGVQIELSSGYHHVSLNNFLSVYKIARLNERELPADFLKRLEKMYDFDVYGAMPDRRLPGVQDGNYYPVRRALEEAVEYFPERSDFRWYATGGREGKPPAETSHAFRWAGYYVMRSGWEPGCPLSLVRWRSVRLRPPARRQAGNRRRGLRQAAPGRSRHLHLRAVEMAQLLHRFAEPQRRAGGWRAAAPARRARAISTSSRNRCRRCGRSSPAADYVEATFDEDFGGEVKRNVTHTRAVLFVKPDFWVVLDTLQAKDGKPHTYDALFHFDAKVKTEGLHAVTQNVGEANLTVAARPDAGLTLRVVEGQEDPPQGWLPRGLSGVRPAPVGIFSAQGRRDEPFLRARAGPKRRAGPGEVGGPDCGRPSRRARSRSRTGAPTRSISPVERPNRNESNKASHAAPP